MKNITFKIMVLTAAFSCGGSAMAANFDLGGMSAADIRGMRTETRSAPASRAFGDETIGVDAAVCIPFKVLKKTIGLVAETNKQLSIIDASAPVFSRSGEFIKLTNIRVDLTGIIVDPTVTLKPYFEAQDNLAIKIQRIQVHVSMSPTPGRNSAQTPIAAPVAGTESDFNKEEMMASIVKVITDSVSDSLTKALVANASPLKASDIVIFRYDKAAWILHARISTSAIKRYLPDGFMGNLHMTGLSFNDSSISVKFQTAQ